MLILRSYSWLYEIFTCRFVPKKVQIHQFHSFAKGVVDTVAKDGCYMATDDARSLWWLWCVLKMTPKANKSPKMKI